MTEPASASFVGTFVSFASGLLVGLFGFDWYALVGGCIGSGIAVLLTTPETVSRGRMIALAAAAMLFGAVAGTGILTWAGQQNVRAVLVLTCLVCAAGMQKILASWIGRLAGGEKP